MPGLTRVEAQMHGFAGGGAAGLQVIGGGSGGIWSTSGTPTGWQWTTSVDTTLLIACCILGANENADNDFSALTFNGDAMTEIGRHVEGSEGWPRSAAPGQQWFYRQNPDIVTNGALAPTLAGWAGGTPTNNCTGIFLFNIKGENATPIDASDFPGVLNTSAATGKTDSVNSTVDDALLLTVGAVQGGSGSTASFSANSGVTMLAQVQTGTSTTTDVTFAGGWKQLGAAGAQSYGWDWVNSDGHGISAVVIRP